MRPTVLARALALGLVALASACVPPPAPPSTISAPAEPPPRRFGDLMAEVGVRFERLGRAGRAGSWELAEYDTHELDEVFENDVPTAPAPTVVHALGDSFGQTQLPALHRAIAARDTAAFDTAYASAAAACNACHQTADHGFIIVSPTPGDAVPVIPAPAPQAAGAP